MSDAPIKKNIVFYHAGCMDGSMAAAVARLKLGDTDTEFVAAAYHHDAPDLETLRGRDIYILDFSFKRPVLEQIASVAAKVVLLDHHKTAAADLDGFGGENVTLVFDMSRSGAGIAWDYFFPDKPRLTLVDYVEDSDLWKKALVSSDEVRASLFSYGTDLDVAFAHIISDDRESDYINHLIREGNAILRANRAHVARMTKHPETVVIAGQEALAVCAPILQSEVGEVLAKHPDGTGIGIAWTWYADKGVYALSLRSDRDGANIDVSEIAKALGGGGHRNAAGCSTKELPWRIGASADLGVSK